MKEPKIHLFVILIPHMEVQRQIEDHRSKLFSIGFLGSHSFPVCTPLIHVSKQFTDEELKNLAGEIRKQSFESDGLIRADENALCNCPPFSFYGPRLNINLEKLVFSHRTRSKSIIDLSPVVICTALVKEKEEPFIPPSQTLSFRAASVANLEIRPMDDTGYSFQWEIGREVWLPAFK